MVIEDFELIPVAAILFIDLNLTVVHIVGRDFKLDVSSRSEIHFFAFRQLQHQLLNESSDIIIGDDFTLPALNAEEFCRDLNLHVLLYRCLT